MIVVDNFISSIDELCSYARHCDFETIKNPYDGVEYPDINVGIPDHIKSEVANRAESVVGFGIKVNALFLRMSKAGVNVPHIAHTDNSMGHFSLMLYLDDKEGSGTATITHKESGISYAPSNGEYISIVVKDQNDVEKWKVDGFCQSKKNRAAIFDASKFHCALPVGGYGESQADARIVLTCFFEAI